eukprot:Phypoly_transcript_05798.p1 GENE.Phypoly_transcript_05798~~Phypoly_transcript_05798.p1  ORF type:complete len:525 (+),score=53.95 Phypoly_transcript_05798:140-1714(+)
MPFRSKIPDIRIPHDITLPDFVVEHYHQYPDRKLLIDPYTKRDFTCQDVKETINKVSAGFYKLGLQKGEVVALALPNMVEYPLLILGIQNLGAMATLFNPSQTVEELTHLFKDSEATYFVTIPLLLNKVQEVLKQVTGQVKKIIVVGEAPGTISFKDLTNNNGEFPRVKFDPRTTVALVPYSSGTTGLPKGVELTHYNIIANVAQHVAIHAAYGTLLEHDTWITFLPIFHVYGSASVLFTAMRKCHTSVIMSKFDKHSYLQFIQEYKATVLPVVPPVVILLSKDPTVSQYDTSSARLFSSGAAPLGAEVEADFKKRLPSAMMLQGYGMTELSPTTHVGNKFAASGSVGQLLPNLEMKIIDVDTGKELGIGQRGEVWFKGPNVMKGYHNNPKATSDMIDKDGFLHTGDVGYVDANENLFIVDRLKELIKYKGFQVPPAELEALLLSHPEVADAAVVGKPDLEAGELPAAFVVLKQDSKLTSKELVEWAEKKTSAYKKLRGGVVFVPAIPKSEAGKILRKILRAKL